MVLRRIDLIGILSLFSLCLVLLIFPFQEESVYGAFDRIDHPFDILSASPDTFGYETQGSNWQSVDDRITGSWFTAQSSGTVDNITAYVDDPGGPGHYKFGIYKKSDGSFVGYTNEAYAPQGGGWLTINITSGGSITGSVDYYLVVWGETNCRVAYDSDDGKGAYDSETYGTWPDPLGETSEDKKCSIYASYTPLEPKENLPYPVADTYEDYNNQDTNYGSSTSLEITNRPEGAYLKFNLEDITDNIDQSLLKIYVTEATLDQLDVYKVDNDDWEENTLTYNNAPDNGCWLAMEEVSGTGWVEFESSILTNPLLTEFLENERTGDNIVSLFIASAQGGSLGDVQFYSREATENNPELVLIHTRVTTEDATNITDNSATFNASIHYGENVDNVWIRFGYRQYFTEEWSLGAYDYTDPLDGWTPNPENKIVAASDSNPAGADYVCDGTADEENIQQAIDAVKPYGTVYLRAGTYYFNGSLDNFDNADNITLMAENSDNKPILYQANQDDIIYVYQQSPDNLVFLDLRLRGNSSLSGEYNGLRFRRGDPTNAVIENCVFENIPCIAIYIENSDPDGLWIVNNRFENTGHSAIALTPTDNLDDVHVVNNEILLAAHENMNPAYSNGTALGINAGLIDSVIANNTISKCGGAGIAITGSWVSPPAENSENVEVSHNKIFNCGQTRSSRSTVDAGIYLSGEGGSPDYYASIDITLRRNEVFDNQGTQTQTYGIVLTEYTENCIIDNNNLSDMPSFWPTNISGTGHTTENNIGFYSYTSWEVENTTSYSKDVEPLDPGTYEYYAEIYFLDNVYHDFNYPVDMLINHSPEVLDVYISSTITVDTNVNVYITIRDNNDLSDVDEVWLKLYENALGQENNDNTRNHYTFKFIKQGSDNWFEVGPDNTSPYDHLVVGSCENFDNTLTTDNILFVIKFSKVATSENDWDIWIKVVDNSDAQDNEEFTNKFSVNNYWEISWSDDNLTFWGYAGETDVEAEESPIVATITTNRNFHYKVSIENGGFGIGENLYCDNNDSIPYAVDLDNTSQILYYNQSWGEDITLNEYYYVDIPENATTGEYFCNFYSEHEFV